MDIQEYLVNPMGKGNSIFMIREMKNILDRQYMEIQSNIRLSWYKLQDKYYIAHIQIPSKSVEKLFYDVLLEFDIDSIPKNTAIINKAKVRVFSNCPSFTYTFAYVFNKNGDLIEWCRGKYEKEIFSKPPVKRNPYELYSYEKSLYFAIKYITSGGRNNTKNISLKHIEVSTYQKIYVNIKSSSDTVELYKKKLQKAKEKEKPKKVSTTTKKQNVPKKTNNKNTKKTKTTNMTKKTNVTKKVRKI